MGTGKIAALVILSSECDPRCRQLRFGGPDVLGMIDWRPLGKKSLIEQVCGVAVAPACRSTNHGSGEVAEGNDLVDSPLVTAEDNLCRHNTLPASESGNWKTIRLSRAGW